MPYAPTHAAVSSVRFTSRSSTNESKNHADIQGNSATNSYSHIRSDDKLKIMRISTVSYIIYMYVCIYSTKNDLTEAYSRY